MTNRIVVTNQAELDAAIAKHQTDADVEIFVDSDPGVRLVVSVDPGDAEVHAGNGSVVGVTGNGRVDRVDGNGRVDGVTGNGRVDWVDGNGRVVGVTGNGRVVGVDGNGRVDGVTGNGRVDRVDGNGRVVGVTGNGRVDRVDGNGRVGKAAGTSVLHLYGKATLGLAGIGATVYLHSQQVTMSGGHVIDMTSLDTNDPATWAGMQAVEIDADGLAHLYKAVDDQLMAGHSWTPTMYPIGEDVTPDEWVENNECGYGLHACPTPAQARDHYTAATRFLEVTCPVTDLRPIDESKAKAPMLHVLREVDIHGDPIEQDGVGA